jgi:hypothetical protein
VQIFRVGWVLIEICLWGERTFGERRRADTFIAAIVMLQAGGAWVS